LRNFLLDYTEYPEHSMTLTSIASILFIVFENIDNASKLTFSFRKK
jgi:hypothetical protein